MYSGRWVASKTSSSTLSDTSEGDEVVVDDDDAPLFLGATSSEETNPGALIARRISPGSMFLKATRPRPPPLPSIGATATGPTKSATSPMRTVEPMFRPPRARRYNAATSI